MKLKLLKRILLIGCLLLFSLFTNAQQLFVGTNYHPQDSEPAQRLQQLLTMDDFGIQHFDAQSRAALMEIIEDRHGKTSLIITSQLPQIRRYIVLHD